MMGYKIPQRCIEQLCFQPILPTIRGWRVFLFCKKVNGKKNSKKEK